MNLIDRLPPGSRIVVIRLRSLGDCVLTTPALTLLKDHRPDLKISVVVEPRFAPVFDGNPCIDETREALRRSDLVLNLHGGTRSMVMTALSRAKLRAGFAHHRYGFVYSHKIPTAQEILGLSRRVHTAEHLASAMFWLGVPRREIPRASLFTDAPPARPPYAVIHPFASAPHKAWPAERFLEVARNLPVEPVFLAGPSDDLEPFREFQRSRESLAAAKSLISGASLFIGNDSGPAHIAAAFGVPVVVLFGPSDPVTWAPWRTEAQVLTSPQMTGIAARDVLDAVESLKVRVC
ncbi:MAG TPA: glycosyltransferase family 9 protein [Bryobacteraceae bacterium]|nr:glycosyltransferase family 9 protein [Bryobacteraceae bacterium]